MPGHGRSEHSPAKAAWASGANACRGEELLGGSGAPGSWACYFLLLYYCYNSIIAITTIITIMLVVTTVIMVTVRYCTN